MESATVVHGAAVVTDLVVVLVVTGVVVALVVDLVVAVMVTDLVVAVVVTDLVVAVVVKVTEAEARVMRRVMNCILVYWLYTMGFDDDWLDFIVLWLLMVRFVAGIWGVPDQSALYF